MFEVCFSSDARDREQLAKNNITHILSIHDTAAPILQVKLELKDCTHSAVSQLNMEGLF